MSTGLITQQGLIVPVIIIKSAFKDRYDDFLEKLTITTPQKMGPNKIAKLYKYTKINGVQCLQLPRFVAKALLKGNILTSIENHLPPERKTSTEPHLTCELFPNQVLILDYLCTNVYTAALTAQGFASCTLNFRAGCGKTFVAAGLIARLKQRTLYVVPKRPLMRQTVRDLKAGFATQNQRNIIIGAYTKKPAKRDPSTDPTNQDITVVVIDSALKLSKEFLAGYSLIIFDEIHMNCSDTRQEIFWKTGARMQFGLSATTADRKDSRDPMYYKHIGQVINAEDIPGFAYENVEFDRKVKIIRYNGPQEYTRHLTYHATGKMFTPLMIKQFLDDPYRTALAIKEIKDLYDWRGPEDQQHCIYVWCEERGPLIRLREIISRAIDGYVMAPEIQEDDARIGLFIGGINNQQIDIIKDNSRIVLTTYQYAGTGISMQKMTAQVFISPRRSNFKQILARTLRRGSDLSIPRIYIDIVDNKTAMKAQLVDRKVAYDYYDMQIEEQKISWEHIRDNIMPHLRLEPEAL